MMLLLLFEEDIRKICAYPCLRYTDPPLPPLPLPRPPPPLKGRNRLVCQSPVRLMFCVLLDCDCDDVTPDETVFDFQEKLIIVLNKRLSQLCLEGRG